MNSFFTPWYWYLFVPCLIGISLGSNLSASAQDTEPKLLSQAPFVLPESAVAAGIDGVVNVTLSLDKLGKVKDMRIHGGPAWPCDTSPKAEIEMVRAAVKKHLMSLAFSPATKDGKAREVEVSLQFAIGDAYKRALAFDDAKKTAAIGKPTVVKAGVVNGKATRLVKPRYGGVRSVVGIQVEIDEQGNVSKAGMLYGHPFLFESSREAACQSKFLPTVLEGKAVTVTGVITYNHVP